MKWQRVVSLGIGKTGDIKAQFCHPYAKALSYSVKTGDPDRYPPPLPDCGGLQ
jgi:hypothetical protein